MLVVRINFRLKSERCSIHLGLGRDQEACCCLSNLPHIQWETAFALKISPTLHNLRCESVHEFSPTRI